MRMSDRRRYIERAQRVRGRTAIAVQQTVHVISSYQLYYSRNEAKGAGGIELRQLFGPFYISFAGRGRFVDLSGNFLLLSFHFLFFFQMGRSDARCVTPPKEKETQGNKDLALDIFATASRGASRYNTYVVRRIRVLYTYNIHSEFSLLARLEQSARLFSFFLGSRKTTFTHTDTQDTLKAIHLGFFGCYLVYILLLLQLFPHNFMKMYWKGPYALHPSLPCALVCVSQIQIEPIGTVSQGLPSPKELYSAYYAAEHSQRPS